MPPMFIESAAAGVYFFIFYMISSSLTYRVRTHVFSLYPDDNNVRNTCLTNSYQLSSYVRKFISLAISYRNVYSPIHDVNVNIRTIH